MKRVVCAPNGTPGVPVGDVRYVLYNYGSRPGEGGVGARLIDEIRTMGLSAGPRAWDFLSIALAVLAADEGIARSDSPDGWTREITLTVAVADAGFWATQAASLARALRFLTTDIWALDFIEGGVQPAPLRNRAARPETVVSLLSGGMDSLIGAIDLVAQGETPLFVSQVAKGDKANQIEFASRVLPRSLHAQLNHKAVHPVISERSQRARSIIFFAFGALAAENLTGRAGRVDLIVPENGYISINPPLTPLRLGSLSTRTTHPYYLQALQRVLDAAGLRAVLRNPYQLKTKGEMLTECLTPALLEDLVGRSTSCGRYARSGFRQCGRCVPCLVRRASFHAAGQVDPTGPYRYDDLSLPGRAHRDFDDVRAVGYAWRVIETDGFDAWLGGALNSAVNPDADGLREVVRRGVTELGEFISDQLGP